MEQKERNHSFEENFRQCCYITCGSITEVEQRNKQEYEQLKQRYQKLYDAMRERMAGDGKLLMEYDDIKNMMSGIEDEAVYRRGFQDCVYLLRFIGLI